MSAARSGGALAVAALVFNAFTWGVSWWPLRHLHQAGLHPLWATTLIFCVAVVALLCVRPGAALELLRTPSLWTLVAAAGITNASFNWAVTLGDVVRVVLLFYLMPLWAALLARPLLGERITTRAAWRVAMALAGAAVVLWPPQGAFHLRLDGNDLLALLGGFSFALNNVMLRREAARSEAARALAMFSGGALVSALLATSLTGLGGVVAPPAPAAGWIMLLGVMACWFLAANLALQFGAARLPGHTTAVVLVTEVFFASASAIALGAGRLDGRILFGGALIVAAALLAAWRQE